MFVGGRKNVFYEIPCQFQILFMKFMILNNTWHGRQGIKNGLKEEILEKVLRRYFRRSGDTWGESGTKHGFRR